MKVLFIEPLGSSIPLIYRRQIPFLGLITVAALMDDADDIRYIDERFEPVPFHEGADLVVLTGLTHQANRAYEIADAFRNKGIPVVMGGIHATVLPDEAKAHVDAVIVGEAEGKWEDMLADLKRGSLNKIYLSSKRPDLKRFRIPRRDLLRSKGYLPFDLIQATRGCPMKCDFCIVPDAFGRRCRYRPPEEVLDEVRGLEKTFFFVDDNMILNYRYFDQIFQGLKDIGKNWFCLGSTQLFKMPHFLDRMAEAGCWAIYIDMGPWLSMSLSNSGSMLKERELYGRFVDRLKEKGMKVVGSFVFGYDHDDEGVFERTVKFALSLRIDEAEFHILTPFPKTRLYQRLEKEGRIIDRDWSHYSATKVVFRPKRMSPETLQMGYWTAWKEFFRSEIIEESPDGLSINSTRIFPDLTKK